MRRKETKWFRRPLVRKLGYLFISLLIATTLWGYVLMSENPDRMKHVSDVPLKFEGGSEADLRSRGFVVLGESQNLLPDVTVTVKTKLNDLPSFGNSAGGEIVSASVSLQGINAPGEYECDVIASTTIGTVYSVEPRTVKITVDELVTRTIPITCAVTGDLPPVIGTEMFSLRQQASTSRGRAVLSVILSAQIVCSILTDAPKA